MNEVVDFSDRSDQWAQDRKKAKQDSRGLMKYDDDKPQMSLLDPVALKDLAQILTFGAKKYEKNNWRRALDDVDGADRYVDAMLRHIIDHMRGEMYDSETNLPHMAHVMCNAMFLTWMIREKEKNGLERAGEGSPEVGTAK
jgi:hypothetical protein